MSEVAAERRDRCAKVGLVGDVCLGGSGGEADAGEVFRDCLDAVAVDVDEPDGCSFTCRDV